MPAPLRVSSAGELQPRGYTKTMKNQQQRPQAEAEPEQQQATGPDKSQRKPGILDAFIDNQVSLRGFISRFMVSSHDIEDVSQETFLRAYKAEQETTISKPRAFLFRVAKNLLLNEFARKSYKVTDYVPDLEILDVLPEGDTLEANVIAQQRLGIYCEAIATLPKQCRRVILMKKVYGLPTKEVARRLGISTSTVEKHMTKALKDCHVVLAERYRDNAEKQQEAVPKAVANHPPGRKV